MLFAASWRIGEKGPESTEQTMPQRVVPYSKFARDIRLPLFDVQT
jgi:hypothetical protein